MLNIAFGVPNLVDGNLPMKILQRIRTFAEVFYFVAGGTAASLTIYLFFVR
jgi:hypothetical protein